jgi:hypothetical protein
MVFTNIFVICQTNLVTTSSNTRELNIRRIESEDHIRLKRDSVAKYVYTTSQPEMQTEMVVFLPSG